MRGGYELLTSEQVDERLDRASQEGRQAIRGGWSNLNHGVVDRRRRGTDRVLQKQGAGMAQWGVRLADKLLLLTACLIEFWLQGDASRRCDANQQCIRERIERGGSEE